MAHLVAAMGEVDASDHLAERSRARRRVHDANAVAATMVAVRGQSHVRKLLGGRVAARWPRDAVQYRKTGGFGDQCAIVRSPGSMMRS